MLIEVPGRTPLAQASPLSKYCLLKLNLRADLFELRLDLGCVVLVGAFLNRLGSALDQVLGFLEAQARDSADFLNDLNLLVASGGQNDRKLGLFLGPTGTRAPTRPAP